MTDSEIKDRQKSSGTVILLVLIGLPLLLFAPLLLSFVEHKTMGSDHVEDFCRTIGVHDFLSMIYRPFFEFFEHLL